MSLGAGFQRLQPLLASIFFVSFYFQYADKDVVSQLGLPPTTMPSPQLPMLSLWNSKSKEMLPSLSFFGHGVIITGQGLQRKRACYYDLDFK